MRRRRPNIRKMARRNDLAGIGQALGYRDDVTDTRGRVYDLGVAVRLEATGALAEFDEPSATGHLIAALGDPSPDVRSQSIEALQSRDDPQIVDAMVAAAIHWSAPPFGRPRSLAVAFLARRGGTHAFEGLAVEYLREGGNAEVVLELLETLVGSVALAVVERVASLAVRQVSSPNQAEHERAVTVLLSLKEAALEPLLAAAESADEGQAEAALLLGRLYDARAVEPLLAALRSHSSAVRRAAAHALGDIRDPRAAEALTVLSSDGNYEVREAALEALSRLVTSTHPTPRRDQHDVLREGGATSDAQRAPHAGRARPGWLTALLRPPD